MVQLLLGSRGRIDDIKIGLTIVLEPKKCKRVPIRFARILLHVLEQECHDPLAWHDAEQRRQLPADFAGTTIVQMPRILAPDALCPASGPLRVQGRVGDSLLEVGQAAGMALEGTCEGQMACSTCHVIVAPDWFDRLPPASEEEEDMLDLAAGIARTSRLSCQIVLTEGMDGLTVRIPPESNDMSRF